MRTVFQQRWFLNASTHIKSIHWYLTSVTHWKTSWNTVARKRIVVRRLYSQFDFLITMSILLATNLCTLTKSRHVIQNATAFFLNCSWLTLQFTIFFGIWPARSENLFYSLEQYSLHSYRKYVKLASLLNIHCLRFFEMLRMRLEALGILGVITNLEWCPVRINNPKFSTNGVSIGLWSKS